VGRSPQGLFLSQRKYVLDIVDKCGLLGAKPADFPMETNHRLALVTCKDLEGPSQYWRLVGCLIYLTITGPELSYSMYILSHFMGNPESR